MPPLNKDVPGRVVLIPSHRMINVRPPREKISIQLRIDAVRGVNIIELAWFIQEMHWNAGRDVLYVTQCLDTPGKIDAHIELYRRKTAHFFSTAHNEPADVSVDLHNVS